MRGAMLTPDATDAEIVKEATRLQTDLRLGPVVRVVLVGGYNDDKKPNRAEVRFDGRAPGPQITVSRFYGP